jgi:transcriptional regulator with XRE-family HTH domain
VDKSSKIRLTQRHRTHKVTPMNKSAVVKRLAEIAGSQQDLAKVLGTTPETISRIANGHYPEPEYLTVILELLELLDALPQRRALPERWRDR